MPDENSSCPIVDFRDEPVRVALDIEHRELFHRVSGGQFPPHFHKIFPDGLFRNSVPNIRGRAEFGMRLGRLLFAGQNGFGGSPTSAKPSTSASRTWRAHLHGKLDVQ